VWAARARLARILEPQRYVYAFLRPPRVVVSASCCPSCYPSCCASCCVLCVVLCVVLRAVRLAERPSCMLASCRCFWCCGCRCRPWLAARPQRPCLVPHASCLMPRASCLVPRASCLMPHASCFCLVPRVSCLVSRASWLMPQASRIVPCASCLMRPLRLGRWADLILKRRSEQWPTLVVTDLEKPRLGQAPFACCLALSLPFRI
jgi:hypothetical protein